ncbi:MAG: hypothetical protein II949_07585 [Prevotella sp.]|nr:hypothetical protein [Prevotella sp.]
MKTKYTPPTTQAIQMEGGHDMLEGSPGGVTATMSGYEEDTDGGFSQD